MNLPTTTWRAPAVRSASTTRQRCSAPWTRTSPPSRQDTPSGVAVNNSGNVLAGAGTIRACSATAHLRRHEHIRSRPRRSCRCCQAARPFQARVSVVTDRIGPPRKCMRWRSRTMERSGAGQQLRGARGRHDRQHRELRLVNRHVVSATLPGPGARADQIVGVLPLVKRIRSQSVVTGRAPAWGSDANSIGLDESVTADPVLTTKVLSSDCIAGTSDVRFSCEVCCLTVIETDVPNMKVSRQVTGIHEDLCRKTAASGGAVSPGASAGPISIGMRKLNSSRRKDVVKAIRKGVMNRMLIGFDGRAVRRDCGLSCAP